MCAGDRAGQTLNVCEARNPVKLPMDRAYRQRLTERRTVGGLLLPSLREHQPTVVIITISG